MVIGSCGYGLSCHRFPRSLPKNLFGNQILYHTPVDHNERTLPDFCQPQALLLLVLLGTMLSILLTLASIQTLAGFWTTLGLISLLVQSVLLSACLLLCGGRRWLIRMPPLVAMGLIFAFIQALVAGYSWFAVARFPALLLTESAISPAYFISRNVVISILASFIFLRYLVLHRQWQLQVQAEASARLAALQARIRPHFLFNALNTVASLIRSKPDQAEQAVLDLSDLLRTGLRENRRHTLGEEMDLVHGYLRIESLRLGDRLKLDWKMVGEVPLDQPMPALLIQPLVENAVVHGIARCPEGGLLSIRGEREDSGFWRLSIRNPLPQKMDARNTGHGMSLDNIQKRLMLAFDDRARLQVDQRNDHFHVSLRIPLVKKEP